MNNFKQKWPLVDGLTRGHLILPNFLIDSAIIKAEAGMVEIKVF